MQAAGRFESSGSKEAIPPESSKVTCPRCSGRCYVICPQCQGTGETRNVSWVVTGLCSQCGPPLKGFVLCPKCKGLGKILPRDMPSI